MSLNSETGPEWHRELGEPGRGAPRQPVRRTYYICETSTDESYALEVCLDYSRAQKTAKKHIARFKGTQYEMRWGTVEATSVADARAELSNGNWRDLIYDRVVREQRGGLRDQQK